MLPFPHLAFRFGAWCPERKLGYYTLFRLAGASAARALLAALVECCQLSMLLVTNAGGAVLVAAQEGQLVSARSLVSGLRSPLTIPRRARGPPQAKRERARGPETWWGDMRHSDQRAVAQERDPPASPRHSSFVIRNSQLVGLDAEEGLRAGLRKQVDRGRLLAGAGRRNVDVIDRHPVFVL